MIPFRAEIVNVMGFIAIFAIPAVLAYFFRVVRFLTNGTVPTFVRTFFVNAVSFATLDAKPGVFRTGLIFRMRFFANGTKPRRFRVFQG